MNENTLLLLTVGSSFAAVFFLVYGLFPAKLVERTIEEGDGSFDWNIFKRLFVAHFGAPQISLLPKKYRNSLENKFILMGEPDTKVEAVLLAQELYAIFFTLVVGFGCFALKVNPAYSILGTGLGFFLPILQIREKIRARQKAILRALPYSLDLLTLSVEAGMDFQAAVATVVEKSDNNPLAEEFGLMLSEIKMGKTREEALRNMAARIQLSQINAFVSNLVQAERMGTSLGKILRIQSTQLRVERSQLAETKANQAPVKMLAPLVACIFPTVFLILFGPIAYALMTGGGGM